MQTQAFSPDALYTAKFVAYNEEEDEDDEPAGQDRPSGRRARPVSDGIFLAGPFRPPPPGTVHGILQARVLKWVAFLFSRGSSQPRD